jgi:hypothetical protein
MHQLGDGLTAKDREVGQELASVTMGIDRLERGLASGTGALDTEGLVPLYLGKGLVEVADITGWEEAHQRLDSLQAAAEAHEGGPRRMLLLSFVASLRAAVQLFSGEKLSFAEKLERLVGVPAAPVAAERMSELVSELDAMLASSGYLQGSLAERSKRWEAERSVDGAKVATLFEELMDEAQERTDARVFPTGDYHMALNPVTDVPYTARCRFGDGLMDLNVDLSFTRSALKHLVAHEVFPGHSTHMLFTHARVVEGVSPADALLCAANLSTGAVQEGIGDQGIFLIDWVDSLDDAIYMRLRALRSAAATNAAWYLMGERWEPARVRGYLQETAFPQPAWLEGRLRMAAHPYRGAFIASYWFGDEAVREVRERVPADRLGAFVEYLYGSLNTVQSVKQFV